MKPIAICAGLGLAAAAWAGPAAAQASTLLGANLLGREVPGRAGDDDASANLNGEIDLKKNQLCYYLDMDGLADATAVHIHRHEQGGSEAPVLALELPGPDGDEVCVKGDAAVLAEIAASPKQFDVDIHTPGHPDGAVRGQFE